MDDDAEGNWQHLPGPDQRITTGTVNPETSHRWQGLTFVHFSAQRKHLLWDTLGA